MFSHQLIFDAWASSLFADLGHDISRIQFTTLFLNGEYWGGFNLRERLDDEWLEITRGIDKEHFILIKDGVSENGDAQQWWDFLDWAASDQDFTAHTFFQQVSRELDLSSYIDWMIINIFVAPSDNGYEHNLVLMKLYDEPWKYVMWDEDDIFEEENAEADYFRFFSSDNEDDFQTCRPTLFGTQDFDEVAPFFLLFNHLMQNAEFRTMFSFRFDELMSGSMTHRSLLERLNTIADEQMPELHWHADLYWSGLYISYTRKIAYVSEWIRDRLPLVGQQKTEFMARFTASVELSRFSAQETPDSHLLNWRTESEVDCRGFLVQQSDSPDGPFNTIATYLTSPELISSGSDDQAAEYSFSVTNISSPDAAWYRLVHVDSQGGEVTHNWIEIAGTPAYTPPLLCINELMAKNRNGITDETGEHEDWIEIYNSGNDTIDLSGMFLTDNLALTTRWEFPPNTSIAPDGFLLVWCDSDEEDGPLHTSFKLSAAGEQCGLFSSLAEGHALVDSLTFGQQEDDISQGRQCDGCQSWIFFSSPTPDASNAAVAPAPLPSLPSKLLMTAYPNPFNPMINIEFEINEGGTWELAVFNPAGRLVRKLEHGLIEAGRHRQQWDGKDDQGRVLSAGIYYLRLHGQKGSAGRKITLVK